MAVHIAAHHPGRVLQGLVAAQLAVPGGHEQGLPPSWLMPTSNETRVRVEGLSKIRATLLPARGWHMAPVALRAAFSSAARLHQAPTSAGLRSRMVKQMFGVELHNIGFYSVAQAQDLVQGR